MPNATPAAPSPAATGAGVKPAADPARAWAPYEPSARRPWDLPKAAHLYRRAGFGATWNQLRQALADGPRRTVDRLLRPAADVAAFNKDHDAYEQAVTALPALRAWWLRRMARTPHPLLEKMTLFWHDFFAFSAANVGEAALVLGHAQLLRAGALGDSRTLTAAVARDPALLLSLGAEANRKARPNERLPRQLLGRYTVGEGSFTDADVHEAARAMTGLFVLRGRLRTFAREYDNSVKTVLGRTGRLDADSVVRIAAGHPATAANIVRRLYRWLISEADRPGDALLAPLVRSFAKDFDVAALVGTMLRSNLFYSPRAIRRRIKRPVELAIGLIRGLEATAPTTPLANHLAALGEDLYHPPTPDGWQGGRCWINHATFIGRCNLAASLLAPSGPYEGKVDPAAVARRHGHTDAKPAAKFLHDLLLGPHAGDGAFERLWADVPAGGDLATRLRAFVRTLASQPEFQLA